MSSIDIHCIADNQYAVIGVLNKKQVRFEIETGQNESADAEKKRNPINLVLVLDRSGSMSSNNKLEYAKEAVIAVLNLLQDDDIVHLVTYDTRVETVFENALASTRENLHSLVRVIHTGGETFLSGGIETGSNLFEKYQYPGYSKRIFVLSDGLANHGLRTKEEIMRLVSKINDKGIIFDSFGVGDDFDPQMMKGIADAGRGQFYFLETANVIIDLMTKALQSVFDIFGTHAQLIIRGSNGAIVTKIWGHENAAHGASLGDIHVNNVRAILCDFTIPGAGPVGTEIEALEYKFKYNLPGDVESEPVVIEGKLNLTLVDDESLVKEVNPKVKLLHAVQVAGEMDDRISELMKNRRREEAINLTNEQINLLREVESLDEPNGMISMLLRLAQNVLKKLNDESISMKAAAQKYHHHGHMKKCYDKKYADYYDED